MNNKLPDLGDSIRTIARERGLSLGGMATDLGVSRTTLGSWFRMGFPLSHLPKILELVDIPYESLTDLRKRFEVKLLLRSWAKSRNVSVLSEELCNRVLTKKAIDLLVKAQEALGELLTVDLALTLIEKIEE